MLSRRSVLAAASASTLLGRAAVAAPSAPDGAAALDEALGAVAKAMLRTSPQTATSLGLDTGANADLGGRLDRRSRAGLAIEAAGWGRQLKALDRLDAHGLDARGKVDLASTRYALGLASEGARFDFGDNSLRATMSETTTPYMVNQMVGAWQTIPDFLDLQHPVASRADAENYLLRLQAFAVALDEETASIRADADHGVILPRFALDMTLSQMQAMRRTPVDESQLVASLVKRAQAAHIAGDFAAPAARLVSQAVYPALDRQIAALGALQARAPQEVGVWQLKDGEAYYAWLLKVATSTTLTPAEVHQAGVDQTAEIEAQMDGLLRVQGLSQGSVGDRMRALSRDPKYLYPNTDAGRAQVVDDLNGLIATARTRLPALFTRQLRAEVVVKRVPPDIEEGAALGYMNAGSLDGSRPSIYYLNLHDTAAWPKWSLPSVTYHETIPGHVWQQAYVREGGHFRPVRSMMDFNAFDEGWALYAEQLADEVGLYEDDPMGRLGFLQLQLFRAGRLMIDTGLHARKFTREAATRRLIELTGRPVPAITSEVNRYCVVPAQSCGYKIGHSEILRMRRREAARLGAGFDKRRFNDLVVSSGSVPLAVLDQITAGSL